MEVKHFGPHDLQMSGLSRNALSSPWRRAENWAVLLLSVGIVLDAAQFLLTHSQASPVARPTPFHGWMGSRADTRSQRIVAAHLFGLAPDSGGLRAAQPSLAVTLSGVFASDDPAMGYAILGRTGRSTRLFRAGDWIDSGRSARLLQVYPDRIVIDLDGLDQTVALARPRPGGALDLVQSVDTMAELADASPAPGFPSLGVTPSQGETLYSALHVDTSSGGVHVYPEKRLQRTYGIDPGDAVAAVNGIPVSDPGALETALRAASGPTSVTFMHDGSAVTVEVPENN
jgi:type II secretory pathway component PulC